MADQGASNQSLARGLAILDHMAAAPGDVGVRELARTLALAPSIVQRLVTTLCAGGFIEQNPETLRYRLGAKQLAYGQRFLAQQALPDIARVELRHLAGPDVSAFFGIRRDHHLIYLVSMPTDFIDVDTQPGARTHLHTTALGKMLLSGVAPTHLPAVVDTLPLPRVTAASITDPAALCAAVSQARADGFATSDEENLPGLFSVGAPVYDRGHVCAAVSLSVPRARIDAGRETELRHAVVAAAARLSAHARPSARR